MDLLAFLNDLANSSKSAQKTQKTLKQQKSPSLSFTDEDYEAEEIRINLSGWNNTKLLLVQTDQKCQICSGITPLINKHILVERSHKRYGIHQISLSRFRALKLTGNLSSLPIVTVTQSEVVDTCLDCYLIGDFRKSLSTHEQSHQHLVEQKHAQETFTAENSPNDLHRRGVVEQDPPPHDRPTLGQAEVLSPLEISRVATSQMAAGNNQSNEPSEPSEPRGESGLPNLSASRLLPLIISNHPTTNEGI